VFSLKNQHVDKIEVAIENGKGDFQISSAILCSGKVTKDSYYLIINLSKGKDNKVEVSLDKNKKFYIKTDRIIFPIINQNKEITNCNFRIFGGFNPHPGSDHGNIIIGHP
jgi:hypothetical protein